MTHYDMHRVASHKSQVTVSHDACNATFHSRANCHMSHGLTHMDSTHVTCLMSHGHMDCMSGSAQGTNPNIDVIV